MRGKHGRNQTKIVYQLDVLHFGDCRRLIETYLSVAQTSRDIPRMLTVGLVSAFEYHLGLLMHQIAIVRPEAVFDREKTVTVRELLNASSLDELKRAIVSSEIDGVLRESVEDQIGWIEKRSGADKIQPNHNEWPNLIEVLERRNLFVHAGGIVNQQYLHAAKRNSFSDFEKLQIGTELHVIPILKLTDRRQPNRGVRWT